MEDTHKLRVGCTDWESWGWQAGEAGDTRAGGQAGAWGPRGGQPVGGDGRLAGARSSTKPWRNFKSPALLSSSSTPPPYLSSHLLLAPSSRLSPTKCPSLSTPAASWGSTVRAYHPPPHAPRTNADDAAFTSRLLDTFCLPAPAPPSQDRSPNPSSVLCRSPTTMRNRLRSRSRRPRPRYAPSEGKWQVERALRLCPFSSFTV